MSEIIVDNWCDFDSNGSELLSEVTIDDLIAVSRDTEPPLKRQHFSEIQVVLQVNGRSEFY